MQAGLDDSLYTGLGREGMCIQAESHRLDADQVPVSTLSCDIFLHSH